MLRQIDCVQKKGQNHGKRWADIHAIRTKLPALLFLEAQRTEV
jgi:hypothetical protein